MTVNSRLEDTRAITSTERRVFEKLLGIHSFWFRIVRVIIAFTLYMAVTAFICIIAKSNFTFVVAHEEALLWIFAGFGLGCVVLWDRAFRIQATTDAAASELKRGLVAVAKFKITSALRITEIEDNGYAFFLKIEDGRVLFLMGQYLYGLTESGKFPAENLEVVYTPSSRMVLAVRSSGPGIPSTGPKAFFTTQDLERGRVPEDGSILDVDFDSLGSSR